MKEIENVLKTVKIDFIMLAGLSTEFNFFIDFVKRMKELNIKTILGGPLVTHHPELIMEYVKPDFAIIGEAEESLVQLMMAIENNTDLSTIKNLLYLTDSGFIKNELNTKFYDINKIKLSINYDLYKSDFLKYFRVDSTTNTSIRIPIIVSRGCVNSCTFCSLAYNYRERDFELIKKELDYIYSYFSKKYTNKHKFIHIIGENPSIDLLKKISSYISLKNKQNQMTISWESYLSCNVINYENLKFFKEHYCLRIFYGLESIFNQKLKSFKKNINFLNIEKVINYHNNLKLECIGNFLTGVPNETYDELLQTLEYVLRNSNKYIRLQARVLSLIPSTELYENLKKESKISDDLDFLKKETFKINFTKYNDNIYKEVCKNNKDIAEYIKNIQEIKRKDERREHENF